MTSKVTFLSKKERDSNWVIGSRFWGVRDVLVSNCIDEILEAIE